MGILEIFKQLAKQTKKAPQAEELGAKYLTKAQGPAKSGRVFTDKDFAELQDQLAFYGKARVLPPEHAKSFQMLIDEAQKPNINTHVLYTDADHTEPTAAFQLTSEHELGDIGNYMPNLVSLLGLKGQGLQALQEARRAGPYGLVNTPASRKFYEKAADGRIQNFKPHSDPELSDIAYEYKAKGGLVRMKECNCG